MPAVTTLKAKLYKVVFESDTRAGRIFDKTLMAIIIFSIVVVVLESYHGIQIKYTNLLRHIEWAITFIFTIEYILRIWITSRPVKYILSLYGVIDLLTLLPSYLALLIPGGQSLLVIRMLRLLRIFRILRLTQYTTAGRQIVEAIKDSKEKISVFMLFALTLCVIIGTMMYLLEGEKNGFTDIPTGIYWAIVTLTTVGYGDISPVTIPGKFFASIVMILGYAIIAVPTGIVTASFLSKGNSNTQVCSNCMLDKHDDDAKFCKKCGASLDNL